jgi:hypothetical protein
VQMFDNTSVVCIILHITCKMTGMETRPRPDVLLPGFVNRGGKVFDNLVGRQIFGSPGKGMWIGMLWRLVVSLSYQVP